jgi:hypothetical protein
VTRDQANRFLDEVRAGTRAATAAEICRALVVTGDIDIRRDTWRQHFVLATASPTMQGPQHQETIQ